MAAGDDADAFAEALAHVASLMRSAQDPWWVIGSAAVVLHGAIATVADIDVLTSVRDGKAAIERWRHGEVVRGASSERFRSTPYARLDGLRLPIEVMGDLSVRRGKEWVPVRPCERVALGGVFVAGHADMLAILQLFGRDKDRDRARQLAALV